MKLTNFSQLKTSRIKIDKSLNKELRDYIISFNKYELFKIVNAGYLTNEKNKDWSILINIGDDEYHTLVKTFPYNTPVEIMISYLENSLKSICEDRYNKYFNLRQILFSYCESFYDEYKTKYKKLNEE